MSKTVLLTAKSPLVYGGIRLGKNHQFNAEKADADRLIANGDAVLTNKDPEPAAGVPSEPPMKAAAAPVVVEPKK